MENFLIKAIVFFVYAVGASLCGTTIALSIAERNQNTLSSYLAARLGAMCGGLLHFAIKVAIVVKIVQYFS